MGAPQREEGMRHCIFCLEKIGTKLLAHRIEGEGAHLEKVGLASVSAIPALIGCGMV